MFFLNFIFMLILVNSSSVFSQDFGVIKGLPTYNSNYLELKLDRAKRKNFSPPTVRIYDNRNLTGEPNILLDPSGLKIKNKQVCHWVNTKNSISGVVLRESNSPDHGTNYCKSGGPIKSGDNLRDASSFWILVKDDSSKEYYEALFDGKPVYIDKKTTSDFEYHKSGSEITSDRNAKRYEALEKLFKEDPSLKKSMDSFRACVIKKDRKCLEIDDKSWTIMMRETGKYMCDNYEYNKQYKLKYLCKDLHAFFCAKKNLSEEQLEMCKNQVLDALPEDAYLPKYTSTEEISAVEKFLWNELGSCFSEDPRKTRWDLENGNLKAGLDENNRTSCSIQKKENNHGKNLWQIGPIELGAQLLESEPTVLYPKD